MRDLLEWIFNRLYTSGGLLGAALFIIVAIKILKDKKGDQK